MNDQVALQLAHELRSLSAQLARNTAIAQAALPTYLGLAELRRKWPALSQADIDALLLSIGGIRREPGQKFGVHLDVVLAIDATLAGRMVGHDSGLRLVSRKSMEGTPCSKRNARGAA